MVGRVRVRSEMKLPRLSTLRIDVEGETKNTLRDNWIKMKSPRVKCDNQIKNENIEQRPWKGRRWRPRRCEMELSKELRSPSHDNLVFVFKKKSPIKSKSRVIPNLNLPTLPPLTENVQSFPQKNLGLVRKCIDENWEQITRGRQITRSRFVGIKRSPVIGLPSLQPSSMSSLVRRVSAYKASIKKEIPLKKGAYRIR